MMSVRAKTVVAPEWLKALVAMSVTIHEQPHKRDCLVNMSAPWALKQAEADFMAQGVWQKLDRLVAGKIGHQQHVQVCFFRPSLTHRECECIMQAIFDRWSAGCASRPRLVWQYNGVLLEIGLRIAP